MLTTSLEQLTQVDEYNCSRGKVVVRGPGWIWGDQDGGVGHVGVILRKFYIKNPYKHEEGSDEGVEEEDGREEELRWSAPERICLAQVRWAVEDVQTYRIGTYGENAMTLSDLCLAPDQDEEEARNLQHMYQFRTRVSKIPEDLDDLDFGDELPQPIELENILLRYFRPVPHVIAQMREVGEYLEDVTLSVSESENEMCDFCHMLISHTDNQLVWRTCEDGEERNSLFATRLPCGHLFHRDCIRLWLMEDAGCPAEDCTQSFDSLKYIGDDRDMQEYDNDDNGDDEFINGATLQFVFENQNLWLRMALVIQHFQEIDNMSVTSNRLLLSHRRTSVDEESGGAGRAGRAGAGFDEGRRPPPRDKQRDSFMHKLRDVLTWVDMPQLEEGGWMLSEPFEMMIIGVRDRNQLIANLNAESVVVVDHLLDLVSRGQEENRRELQGKLSPHMSNSNLLAVCGRPSDEALRSIFACLLASEDDESVEEGGGRELRACGVGRSAGDLENFRQMVVPVLEMVLCCSDLQGLLDESKRRREDGRRKSARAGEEEMGEKRRRCWELLREVEDKDERRKSRFIDVRVDLFKMALLAYWQSSFELRGPNNAYRFRSGLRWLRNVCAKLTRRRRHILRETNPFYLTEMGPHVGGNLILWLMGFRWKENEEEKVPWQMVSEGMGKEMAHQVATILTQAVRARGLEEEEMVVVGRRRSGGGGEETAAVREESQREDARKRAKDIAKRNLDRVCDWVAGKIKSGMGSVEWAVLELEVLPRLEDVGVGFEGSFTRAVERMRDGEREEKNVAQGCDTLTCEAISRVLRQLRA